MVMGASLPLDFHRALTSPHTTFNHYINEGSIPFTRSSLRGNGSYAKTATWWLSRAKTGWMSPPGYDSACH